MTSITRNLEDTQDKVFKGRGKKKTVIKSACVKEPWHCKALSSRVKSSEEEQRETQREQCEQVPGGERTE